MAITPEQFRGTLRLFGAGVTLVTVRAGEQTHGFTATAFVSISQEPPLIGIVADHRGRAIELFREPGAVFAVNFLTHAQQPLSDRFAWSKEDRFAMGAWTTAHTGAPVLADALAWLDCTLFAEHVYGGNTLYIGRVEATWTADGTPAPLLYHNRAYHTLAPLPIATEPPKV